MASRRTRWIVLVDRTSCHWLGHQLQMRDMSSIFVALCPNFTENGTNIKQTPHWSARATKIFLCKRNGKHSFTKIFWFSEFPYFRIWLFFIVFHRISLKYGFLQKIHCANYSPGFYYKLQNTFSSHEIPITIGYLIPHRLTIHLISIMKNMSSFCL